MFSPRCLFSYRLPCPSPSPSSLPRYLFLQLPIPLSRIAHAPALSLRGLRLCFASTWPTRAQTTRGQINSWTTRSRCKTEASFKKVTQSTVTQHKNNTWITCLPQCLAREPPPQSVQRSKSCKGRRQRNLRTEQLPRWRGTWRKRNSHDGATAEQLAEMA